jgi:hypothetical protein
MSASQREKIDELTKILLEGISDRKLAIYPPNDKRKLPDDIAKQKVFVQLKRRVEAIHRALSALDRNLHPSKRDIKPIKINKHMQRFLRLDDEFDGFYSRELLVKAINLYTSIKGLSESNVITLDARLAKAMQKEKDEKIQRTEIFRIVSNSISKVEIDEEKLAELLPLLFEEQKNMGAIADLRLEIKDLEKQISLMEENESADLFKKEITKRKEQLSTLQEQLDDLIQSNRFLKKKE